MKTNSKAKMDFIIQWCKEEDSLTSYTMSRKVIKWMDTFYPNTLTMKQEKNAISNLTSYFRKLVTERILHNPDCIGLGEGSKCDFFGTTRQYNWRVNKYLLNKKYANIS